MEPLEPLPGKLPMPPTEHKNRSWLLWGATLVLLLVGIIWLIYWLLIGQFHAYTDNAYANGSNISINAAVAGSAIAFFADDTDLVEEGQLLVLLDPTEYQVNFNKELATLASTVLDVRQLYHNVEVNRANVGSKKISAERAAYDYQNRAGLIQAKAVSGEDYSHAKDDLSVAQQELEKAEHQLQVAIDAAGQSPIEIHPQIEKQKGVVRAAYYRLQHCAIFAPATGFVAQRAVNVGQWVEPRTFLMSVIPKDYMWVDANFKETQLTFMRIGQPATVWFDIYGSKVAYQGEVLGIASGTGSVFSIIPPQNATGNWIKIVQRLPVRISLDAHQLKNYPARLGLSAEVDVDITNQNLPVLAPIPSTRAIATTQVFDIDLKKVNALMDKVIQDNLKE